MRATIEEEIGRNPKGRDSGESTQRFRAYFRLKRSKAGTRQWVTIPHSKHGEDASRGNLRRAS